MNEKKIAGRAYTDEEKRAIVERLYAVWTKEPALRLSQLIWNAMQGRDFFYMEDEVFLGEVERMMADE